MGFGLLGTIKLIKDLDRLFDVSRPMVDAIGRVLANKHRSTKETERVDDLEKAMSMQARLNEQYENQIKVVQSTLGNIEKSLKVLVYALVGVISLSVAAIVIAVLR